MPDVFKVSKVTPVFKSGTLSDPSNYRPIATLSPFSKALERFIYDQLIKYLDKHDVLFKYQFGFRKNHSTEQAIMEITDNLKASIDSNFISCGLFLDFSKAFDTVNHQILLDKLCKYGVRGRPHDWFASYLQDRKQFVQIRNEKSSLLEMTCGVPHKIFNKSSNIPSLFHDSLRTVSSLHKYNTRYASKGNFHRPKVRTNTGKFTFVYVASKLWETVPTNLKWLSIGSFKKRYKDHLLKCQS